MATPSSDYDAAYAESLRDPERFWARAAEGLSWTKRWDRVLDDSRAPFFRWFPGGVLNTCYNAVDRHVERGRGRQPALIYDSPVTGTVQTFTYVELRDRVARLAGTLRAFGVEKGDRVVIYMPAVPEAVFAMLACARLGAIHSVVFGGFASKELATRIDDARPKVILSGSCGIEADRVVLYKPLLDRALEMASHKPAHCLILQRPQAEAALERGRDVDWAEALTRGEPADCVPVAATDLLYIHYTSGTTGVPKGVVRDNGGHAVALQWSMAHVYGIGAGEVFWAASDIGWTVGHGYIVYGPLLQGATTVLYEGKPVGTPDAGAFWRLCEQHGVNVLFTAPTAFRAIKRDDPSGRLMAAYDLSRLRLLFLAGERCDPTTLEWAREKLGIPVIDHWWQTELGWPAIANCVGLGMLPVKPGSPARAVPGYDIRVLDDEGRAARVNQTGTIVIRLPLPPGSLPTLWHNDEGFIASYLSQYPGYYMTGDAGYTDDDGYFYVLSRVDDIINVAGHRLSTGSIEEVLAGHPDVAECAVIGAADELKGEIPVGFVVVKAGVTRPEGALVPELVERVRHTLGAFTCFKTALVVKALPKTRSGKILRGTMKKLADGVPYTLPATIEDPGVLADIGERLKSIGYAGRSALCLLLFCLAGTATVWGQYGTKNGEWRTHGGDLGSTKYAPLDQINRDNFNDLRIAWRFKTDNLGPRPEFDFQAVPLVVNGVLYTTGGTRRNVVALDAATGEVRWFHRSPEEGPRAAAAPRRRSGKGVAYWTDGKGDERILYVTIGYQLVALDARTGHMIPGFGQGGVVDLKQQIDQELDPITGEIGLHAAPIVARNVVVVGAAHLSGGAPKSRSNAKGYVRGFDVRTGKRLWIFHTIPQPGEFGHETWEDDSWAYTGNTGVWAQMTVDEELGILYLPVETPTGDFYGGHRPGNNLFAESLVAVNLETGKRIWHYQFIHHGIWDWDIPCAPVLTDITVNGKRIKAVAQPTKQGWVYVFDRQTGQPVWPIEERPVPQSDAPGERTSPTQPFPTRPPAFDRQAVTADDLIDFTPELKAEALKLFSQYKAGPMFTPALARAEGGPLGVLMLPGIDGGANWPGGSFDPETGILYVASQTRLFVLSLVKDPKRSDMDYINSSGGEGGGGGAAEGGGGGLSVQGLPLVKPPWGRITAIDLNKGEIVWQVAHGETPDNVRSHPALKGLTIPRTGRPAARIGSLVTKTLVIAGEAGFFTTPSGQRGAMLRAYDKATGAEVGEAYMPAPQTGAPVSYMLNGKQHIVVAISGGNYSGELLAFRLP